MDSEKNNIIYTAEDIQKYLSGKLGPAEMHAMERAALDDAFLAEAMEGYEGMQAEDWERQLLSLKNNFIKAQPAKVLALEPVARHTFWKIAAAILVIFGGVTITYILTTKEYPENNSIALINKKQDSVNNSVGESRTADTEKKITSPLNTKSRPANHPIAARSEKESRADNTFIYRPGAVDKKELKKDSGGGYMDDQLKKRNDLAISNAPASAAKNNLEPYKTQNNEIADKAASSDYAKKAAPVVTRKFAAQVVGPDGTPLPFANIRITNENMGTYADAKGNFQLISADSLLNIEIKSAGSVTRNFTLRNDLPQIKIVLADDEFALKEKTVVAGRSYSSALGKKRKAVLVPDSVINVEPEDGWNNYDTYIANNLSIPDNILQKKIHGEVAISFEVQSDGVITNVKIDKSLCDDCDEAALRVIKEGPRWKVKKGSQGSGKVKVKF
ncbi:MAG: TonB family protein [Ferruginibacter sp.]